MAQIVRRKKEKKPKKPRPAKPTVAPIMRPEELRVPEERGVLIKALTQTAIIIVVGWGAVLGIGLNLPQEVGWPLIALAALWCAIPSGWVLARALRDIANWRRIAAQPSDIVSPPTRLRPRTIVHEICQVLRCPEPTVKLIPGRPNVVSAQNTILVTEELYQQTSDRDLLVLLLHEVGHIFLGHLALLPFARAVPSPEDETWQGLLMLPVLPWVFALREWGLVADVSADRLVAVMKSDLNLAILGVMKQVVLTAPDSESRSNLVRFLGTAKAQADRGEEVMISSQIRTLFAAHPDAEMRIENLRSWFQADAYAGLTKRLRETAAAQKTR